MEDPCLLKTNFALPIDFTPFVLKTEIFHGHIAEVFCCINLLFHIRDCNCFRGKVKTKIVTWPGILFGRRHFLN